MYNTFSDAIIILTQKEFNQISKSLIKNINSKPIKLLKKMGFVVLSGTDETASFFEICNKNLNKRNDKYIFTILTTSCCNAKCFYCYENGKKYESMSDKTANDVINFIKTTIQKNSKKRKAVIKIHWFGGEPLLNTNAINIICNGIKEEIPNAKFYSIITTNGSLFKNKLIKTAKLDWNLSQAQITLDGLKDEHDKRKNYCEKHLYSFDSTIKNVKLLLESGIKVKIRINLDKNNFFQAEDILKFIKQNLDEKNLSVYFGLLMGESETNFKANDLKKVYNKLLMLKYRYGFIKTLDDLNLKSSSSYCSACVENNFTIAPNGRLDRCQHTVLIPEYGTGNVSGGLIKNKNYFKWTESNLSKKCYSCVFLPNCHGGCKCFSNGIIHGTKCRLTHQKYTINNLLKIAYELDNQNKMK